MTPSAALALDLEPLAMTITSELLGTLEVDPADCIHFATGLFGFPDCHDFVLIRAERPGLFWLQSTDESALTFLLADPFQFFPGYSVDVSPSDFGDIADSSAKDILVLSVVTLPSSSESKPTANLQGPVIFNMRTRTGRQIVLESDEYDTRSPFQLDPAAEPK